MSWRWSRLLGISLTSALVVSCSKGGSGTETEGRVPGHVAESTSSSDLDAGVDSVALHKAASKAFGSREYKGARLSEVLSTKLRRELQAGKGQDVLIVLERPAGKPGSKSLLNASAGLREKVLRNAGGEVAMKKTFDHLGYALVHVKSEAALDKLLAQSQVTRIVENRIFRLMSTASSAAYIGQSAAADAIAYDADAECAADDGTCKATCNGGFNAGAPCDVLADCVDGVSDGTCDGAPACVGGPGGATCTVVGSNECDGPMPDCATSHYLDDLGSYENAVPAQVPVGIALLDGKVDVAHANFGCATAGETGCAVADFQDLTTQTAEAVEDHATAMAGIIHAVAPAATIYNVDITDDDGVTDLATVLSGLQYVAANWNTGEVSAVSLSVGDDALYADANECEESIGLATAVDTLLGLDIMTFAASGNHGGTDGMSSPACLGNVVAVGAVQGKTASGVSLTKLVATDNTCTGGVSDGEACGGNSDCTADLTCSGQVCTGGPADGQACTGDPDCADTSDGGVSGTCGGGVCGSTATACATDSDCQANGVCSGTDSTTTCSQTSSLTDRVLCNSNSSFDLDLLAPGLTVDIDGTGGLAAQSGTSVAAAHAAAAFAIVLGGNETQGVERALSRLKAGGTVVTDPRNNLQTPRLDLAGALADCAGPLLSTESVSLSATGTPQVDVTIETDVGCGTGIQCVGGDHNGEACSDDTECAASSGTCAAAVCSGGANDGTTCSLDSECEETDGTCAADPGDAGTSSCTGGPLDGEPCSDDTECAGSNDGTCERLCTGGSSAGSGCTGDPDCAGSAGTCAVPGDSWITASISGNTISISATDNSSGEPREGAITAFGQEISVSQAGDTAPPTGTAISIPAAVGGYVRSTTVILSLVATGATQVCVMNDNAGTATECTGSWTTFTGSPMSKGWALATATGSSRTVKAWFRDALLNETTSAASVTVSLDQTVPTSGTLTTVAGNANVLLTVTGASDGTGSGVDQLVVARGTSVPSSCSGGTAVSYASGVAFNDPIGGLVNGTSYYYRVCARDVAGNTSVGAVSAAVRPKDDLLAPSGTITAGATYYTTTAATLNITSDDDRFVVGDSAGVATPDVCVSTSALSVNDTCPDTVTTTGLVNNGWQAVSGSQSITLSAGDGKKTYYYKFRDAASGGANISTVQTVLVYIDTKAPGVGSLTATPAAGFDASLKWSGFADATGVVRYEIRYSNSATAPSTCGTGTLLVNLTTLPLPTTRTDGSATSAITRSYTICAYDRAGRASKASAANVALRSEVTKPVLGTITALASCTTTTQCFSKSGVKWTKDTTPVITVSLTDNAALGTASKLCFNTGNTISGCTWQNVLSPSGTASTSQVYSPAKALTAGTGLRSYYVFAKDAAGNISTSKKVDVRVDTSAPTMGTTFTSANYGTTGVKLTWTQATDSGSGLAASTTYVLRYAKGTTTSAPTAPSCTTGTGHTFTSSPTTVTTTKTSGLSAGYYYTFRLCAKDALGTWSAGKTRTFKR